MQESDQAPTRQTLDLPLLLMLFCSKFEDSAISWQVLDCALVLSSLGIHRTLHVGFK